MLLKSSLQLFYPYRLHIMNILFKENEITFRELRKRLDISEGTLHNHFRYLEKDKIVTYRKEFRNRRATTIYSITEKGIDEFTKLRERLFEVLK
ncbi:MAG TPA: transcriptional regulator [Nitrososphaeraceae archaeon]